MDNFLVAVRGIIPLYFFIGIGLFVKFKKLMTYEEVSHFNKMLFRIFYFIMLFYNTYRTDMQANFRPHLMLYGFSAVLIMFAATFALVCFFDKSNRRRSTLIQGIFRSNFIFMGIPLLINIFGDKELGVTTMMIAIIVPTFNVLGVLTMEVLRSDGQHAKPLQVLKNILTNPMVAGAICGGLCLALGIKIPAPILKPLGQMAGATSMLVLIVLGASFHLSSTKQHMPQLISCIVARLIICPGLILGLAYHLGFHGAELMTLVAIFASPCGTATFTLAQQMGGDPDLAGNEIVFSTAFSALTICTWIALFKSLNVL